MNLSVVAQQDRWEDLYGCWVLENAKQGGVGSVKQKSTLSSIKCWLPVWRLELPKVLPLLGSRTGLRTGVLSGCRLGSPALLLEVSLVWITMAQVHSCPGSFLSFPASESL